MDYRTKFLEIREYVIYQVRELESYKDMEEYEGGKYDAYTDIATMMMEMEKE